MITDLTIVLLLPPAVGLMLRSLVQITELVIDLVILIRTRPGVDFPKAVAKQRKRT